MLAFQRSQLAQLLRHARAHSPFYASRLDLLFDRDGEIDWPRWQDVPLLTRTDLQQHRESLLAASIPPGHGPTHDFSTSGSSGAPVTVTATALSTTAKQAAMLRMEDWHGIRGQGPLAILKSAGFFTGTPTPGNEERWCRVTRNDGVVAYQIDHRLSEAEKINLIIGFGARHVVHLPNTIEILARENDRLGRPLRLETVRCYGQGVSPEQRQLFAESFGARTMTIYSSKEGDLMACEGPSGPHYLVNAELVFLELLNERDQPCAVGETGRVVITPFFSTAQPLIRYVQGDLATWGEPEVSGITLPVLARIEGRVDPIFRLPERDVTETRINMTMISDLLKATAVQIAQKAPLELEVRYLAAENASRGTEEAIAVLLRKDMHPDLTVTCRKVDEIPRNAGGKQQRYVREFA